MMTELDSFSSSSSLTTGGHHSDCLSELVQSTIFDDVDHGGGNGLLPPISSFASADLFSSSSSSTAAAAAKVEDEESYQFLESFFLSSIPSSSPSEPSPPPPSLYDPLIINCNSTPVLTTTNTTTNSTTTTPEALSSTVENAGPPPTQMLLLNATSSNQLLPSMTAHFTAVQTFPPPPPPPPAQTKTKSSLCSRGAPEIVVRFTRQPPESVRKINFFNFSLELFEVGEPSSVSPYQQQQQQFQQPQQSLQPVTVWKSSFVRFLGEEDGTRNGAQYHLHLVRPRKSASSSSPTKSSFPTKEQFSTVVTLTLLVVDAATKAVVRYEGGDKNADLQRVLLTHSAICSRCSIQKQLCGNEKDSPSAPRLDQSRITGGTSLTFFLRCNQNCFKAAAANSFSEVSRKTSGPRLSPLTIEALTCRRRKFQLAVIVDVGVAGSGSSNDEVVPPVAYFSTEFFVHNSSKMLLGDGRSSSVASTLHSRSPSLTPLLPARKKLCTAAEKKKQQPKKEEEESSNAAEEVVVVRTPGSYQQQQQQPSFTITSLSPAQGPPGTELHLLGLHLDSKSSWSSPEVKLFLQGWQLPLTTAQPLLPTALSPNALKVTLPPELASLVPVPNSLLTVALVDRATGTTAHCPVPFQLLEEEEKKIASDSQMRSSSSGVSEEEEFLLSRLHQLLPERSALMEGGRYSASFNGSKQTLSSSSPSSPSSPVSSHEILERAALFLDWYHGQQQKLQQQKLMKQQQQQQQQYQQQQQQQETLNSFLVSETAAVPEQQQLGVMNSDQSLTEAVVPVSASLPPSSPTSSLEQQHQEKLPSFATLTSAIKNSSNNNGENTGFYFQSADQVISSTELLYDCSPPPPPPLSSSSSSSSSSSTTEQAATAGSGYEANDFIMYDYYEHFQSQAQQQQQQFPDPLPPAQSCNQSSFY